MVLLEEISDDDSSHHVDEISDDDKSTRSVDEDASAVDAVDGNIASLKNQAFSILKKPDEDLALLPSALNDLLTTVVKALFSTSKHPQLTSTGRKNLLPSTSSTTRPFGYDSILDDSKPWKNDWTAGLVLTILGKYFEIKKSEVRKLAIEADFHLLVPPILILIDDGKTDYKVKGCHCLRQLCRLLVNVQSNMMKRTGLTEVFVEALQKTFNYLPTLTPDEESLQLMEAVYPAYFALLNARFIETSESMRYYLEDMEILDNLKSKLGLDAIKANPTLLASARTADQNFLKEVDTSINGDKPLPQSQIRSEIAQHQSLLTSLLRDSLLHSLSHLSTGGTPSGTNTTSPLITSFLLGQVKHVVTKMGIYATAHLQDLLPLLKNMITDPFLPTIIAANTKDNDSQQRTTKAILLSSIESMTTLISTCQARIRDRWWSECLAALVECWMNMIDELEDIPPTSSSSSSLPSQRRAGDNKSASASSSASASTTTKKSNDEHNELDQVKTELKRTFAKLKSVMEKRDTSRVEFADAIQVLVQEEGLLADLFS